MSCINCSNETPDLRSNTETILASIVNIAFSLCGTLGNLLVCIVITRHKELRTVTNCFIYSLAVADLLVCVISQPMYVGTFYGIQNYEYELVRKTFTWISVLASVSNLWAVTVDRFVAISKPLKYTQTITTKRVAIILVFIWVISTSLGTMATFFTFARTIVQLYIVGMLLCIVPIYIRVFCIARRHARTIATQNAQLKRQPSLKFATRQISRVRENVAARTVGIVLVLFLVCWFPLIILPFVYRSLTSSRAQIVRAFTWVNTLALCSSAVNPIIYSWKTETFRKKMRNSLVLYRKPLNYPRLSLGGSNESRTRTESL